MLLKDNIIHINIRPGLLLGLFYVYITTIFAKNPSALAYLKKKLYLCSRKGE